MMFKKGVIALAIMVLASGSAHAHFKGADRGIFTDLGKFADSGVESAAQATTQLSQQVQTQLPSLYASVSEYFTLSSLKLNACNSGKYLAKLAAGLTALYVGYNFVHTLLAKFEATKKYASSMPTFLLYGRKGEKEAPAAL